jgi:hypothetical protein
VVKFYRLDTVPEIKVPLLSDISAIAPVDGSKGVLFIFYVAEVSCGMVSVM